MDRWPSFTDAAPTAKRIVIGKVDKAYLIDSADNAVEFHFAVTDVLRGLRTSAMEFRGGTYSGAPLHVCPRDSILRVRVGDVLALAFDARIAGAPNRVLAVAWIRGRPHPFLMPGAEKLTEQQVRGLALLPPTDSRPSTSAPSTPGPGEVVFIAAAVATFISVIRIRRRVQDRR